MVASAENHFNKVKEAYVGWPVSDEDMDYDKLYEKLNALNEKHDSGKMTDAVYEKRVDEAWEGVEEVKGAKHLYINATELDGYVFIQLASLHAVGFESEIGVDEDYDIKYVKVYKAIK